MCEHRSQPHKHEFLMWYRMPVIVLTVLCMCDLYVQALCWVTSLRSTLCPQHYSEWWEWLKWVESFASLRVPREFGRCCSPWPCHCQHCSTFVSCCFLWCSSLPYLACPSSCMCRAKVVLMMYTTSRLLDSPWSCSSRLLLLLLLLL